MAMTTNSGDEQRPYQPNKEQAPYRPDKETVPYRSNKGGFNSMKIGDHVVYFDEKNVQHDALVTSVNGEEVSNYIHQVDVMFISQDPIKQEEVFGQSGDRNDRQQADHTIGAQKLVDDKAAADRALSQATGPKFTPAGTGQSLKPGSTAKTKEDDADKGRTATGTTKQVFDGLIEYAYNVPHMTGPNTLGPFWRKSTEQN